MRCFNTSLNATLVSLSFIHKDVTECSPLSFVLFLLVFYFSSAVVFSADNASVSTEPSASQVMPQNTSNTQLPEWFYRELTSIRKDVSVLDATGASKEQIQELKERIGKVEVRLEESQLRVDEKLNGQSGRIGDIADSNSSSLELFSILAGALGLAIVGLSWFFSSSAKREAVSSAKEEAEAQLTKWISKEERKITSKFEKQLQAFRQMFEDELSIVRNNTEIQSAQTDINRGLLLARDNKIDEAIHLFESVIKRFSSTNTVNHQRQVAIALFWKAHALSRFRLDEAIKVYSILFDTFSASEDTEVQRIVARGLFNRGVAFGEGRSFEEGILSYRLLVDLFKESDDSEIQSLVSKALANKAEYALVYQNRDMASKSIIEALSFIKNEEKELLSIIEMLSFIIGNSSLDQVIFKIAEIPNGIKLGWKSKDLRPVISELKYPKKEQVEALARFFDEHKDKNKLKEELDQIPNT